MRLSKIVEKKLEKLIEVQQRHSQKPETCPACGRPKEFYSSWIHSDYGYISGEIDALRWVLGKTDQLTEDHT